jgi:hypothetical protein
MFEEKQSQPNKQTTDKDINLLPENLRKQEQAYRVSAESGEDIRYSRATGASTNLDNESDLSTWTKLKQALLGKFKFGRKNQPLPPRQVANPASPLQRLYAQDIKNPLPPAGSEKNSVNLNIPAPIKLTPKPEISPVVTDNQPLTNGKPLSVLEKIDQQLQKGIHFADRTNSSDEQFGVNLIPEDMVSEINEKKIVRLFLWSVFVSLFLIGIGYLVIEFLQLKEAKEIQKLKQEIQIYEDEFISKSDDLKALVKYQQTYDNIKLLLDSHLYWNKLFEFLETNVADNVYFLNVSADKNGLVSMALTAKDYESLANQYEIFKSAEGVVSVEMTEAALGGGNVSDSESTPAQIPEQNITTQTSSTTSPITDLRKLLLNSYKNNKVSSQVRLQLDTNMFYRK